MLMLHVCFPVARGSLLDFNVQRYGTPAAFSAAGESIAQDGEKCKTIFPVYDDFFGVRGFGGLRFK